MGDKKFSVFSVYSNICVAYIVFHFQDICQGRRWGGNRYISLYDVIVIWLPHVGDWVNDAFCLFQMHVAAANGYLDVMEFLLDNGALIDVRDKDGWQPIHAAVCWGQVRHRHSFW